MTRREHTYRSLTTQIRLILHLGRVIFTQTHLRHSNPENFSLKWFPDAAKTSREFSPCFYTHTATCPLRLNENRSFFGFVVIEKLQPGYFPMCSGDFPRLDIFRFIFRGRDIWFDFFFLVEFFPFTLIAN